MLLAVLLPFCASALAPPSWTDLQTQLAAQNRLPTAEPPLVYDAVHHRAEPPPLPDDTLVFYRERNGWCPYSWRAVSRRCVIPRRASRGSFLSDMGPIGRAAAEKERCYSSASVER